MNQAPKIVDLGALWNELFNDSTPDFPRTSETAWGFDEDEKGKLRLDEEVDGLSTTGSEQEVVLSWPHTFDIHTEPGITKEKLAKARHIPPVRVTDRQMFGASVPRNYLPDVHRLLQYPKARASMIIRMEGEGDLWAVSLAIKTGSYKQPTDWERIGEFGRFGRTESLHYNLSFDNSLKKYDVVVYRGFVRFPPKNDGTNYLRIR